MTGASDSDHPDPDSSENRRSPTSGAGIHPQPTGGRPAFNLRVHHLYRGLVMIKSPVLVFGLRQADPFGDARRRAVGLYQFDEIVHPTGKKP
jgi:hypothetical protein